MKKAEPGGGRGGNVGKPEEHGVLKNRHQVEVCRTGKSDLGKKKTVDVVN